MYHHSTFYIFYLQCWRSVKNMYRILDFACEDFLQMLKIASNRLQTFHWLYRDYGNHKFSQQSVPISNFLNFLTFLLIFSSANESQYTRTVYTPSTRVWCTLPVHAYGVHSQYTRMVYTPSTRVRCTLPVYVYGAYFVQNCWPIIVLSFCLISSCC